MKTNQIICGNCVDVMKQWPADCIDLTVTSPPYDNLRNYQGFNFDFGAIAQELYYTIKPGGIVVWVVGDATIKGSETGTSFKQALYFKEIGFRLHDTMIYAKNNYLPGQTKHRRYANGFEYMFIFSKGQPKIFNPTKEKCKCTGQKTGGFREKNGIVNLRNSLVQDKKIISNVWFYTPGYMKSTTDKIVYKHPAIFPEKLAADHIRSWSNPGDIILDPMCGSGTTCKEAKKLNRQYIGIDISPEYCEIARERLL